MMIKPTIETVDGVEQRTCQRPRRGHGALVRALWTIDRHDEFIGGESFNEEFNLHIIESEGEPMAHLTRYRVPQIVLFGRDQQLKTPLNLSAGRHIALRPLRRKATSITINRFHAGSVPMKRSSPAQTWPT